MWSYSSRPNKKKEQHDRQNTTPMNEDYAMDKYSLFYIVINIFK